MKIRFRFAMPAFLLAAVPAFAAQPYGPACQQEIRTYCGGVVPGEGRIDTCMSNRQLSPPCDVAFRAWMTAHAAPSSFNAAAFDWTNPANYELRSDASNYQRWNLLDPAARAYLQAAKRAGQTCVVSFMRGVRPINMMVPSISPACPRR